MLSRPETLSSTIATDVINYSAINSHGSHQGPLLTDLEGVVSREQQIDIARQKGGISTQEKYTLERFEVVRHT